MYGAYQMDKKDQTSSCSLKALNVELLGKPIHVIRDKLESLLNSACPALINDIQNWAKVDHIDLSLRDISLHNHAHAGSAKSSTTTMRHRGAGLMYVHVNNALLITLADKFYGANIERSSELLTSSDFRLQERIAQSLSQWVAPESTWHLCDYQTSSGIGIQAIIDVKLGDITGELTVEFDSTIIQTFIDELELSANLNLEQDFQHALHSAPVRLNVLLSKKTLPLSDVLDLAPNDILPIELLSTVPASIGSETLFSGRVAEQEGQLVLILNDDKEPRL